MWVLPCCEPGPALSAGVSGAEDTVCCSSGLPGTGGQDSFCAGFLEGGPACPEHREVLSSKSCVGLKGLSGSFVLKSF